jgi:hypothetical protein
MAQRLEFQPAHMRDAAAMFERHARDGVHIVEHLLRNHHLQSVPPDDLIGRVQPQIESVRRRADRRGGRLIEIANFVRARALLAELADQVEHGKLEPGAAKSLLPFGSAAVVGGLSRGLSARAAQMEREFLKGGWMTGASRRGTHYHPGSLNSRGRSPLGQPPSWSKISSLAKKLGGIGKFAGTVNRRFMLGEAIFNSKNDAERIKAVSGILGSRAGGTMAVAATIAMMSGGPITIGAATIAAAIIGGYGGGKIGEFLGKNVVTPLWNGTKGLAKGIGKGIEKGVKAVVNAVS